MCRLLFGNGNDKTTITSCYAKDIALYLYILYPHEWPAVCLFFARISLKEIPHQVNLVLSLWDYFSTPTFDLTLFRTYCVCIHIHHNLSNYQNITM